MRAWKLDTLDARGGLAFASWREDDLADNVNLSLERPCIFIGAPDFQPEPVASRAIALSAGRGAFQTGLFVEGMEVPFPTPADVVEFVRRTYLRSGGGDGADGGGGGDAPPPRLEGGPDLPILPEIPEGEVEGERLRPEIDKSLAEFSKTAHSLSLLEMPVKRSWQWRYASEAAQSAAVPRPSKPVVGDGPDMLAAGALRVIHEMLRRLPSVRDPHAIVKWQRDARRLGQVIGYLDIWPLLLSDPYYQLLKNSINNISGSSATLPLLSAVRGAFPDPFLTHVVIWSLFFDGPALDDADLRWYHFEWLMRHGSIGWTWMRPWPYHAGDPTSDLFLFPLPEGLKNFVAEDLKDDASLYHALTAFAGSPTAVSALRANAKRAALDVLMFASACIVGPAGGRSLSAGGWQEPFDGRGATATERAAVEALADDSWAWLAEHLPTTVFSEPVEKAIESASSLRYRA